MQSSQGPAVSTPLFEAKNLSKDFILPHGQVLHVLDKIDLTVNPEEVVAIIGPSGCGKSTLLRILAGLIPASSGERLYHGQVQEGFLPKTAMVFQSFALYPWMTVRENIDIVLKAIGMAPEEREKKVLDAISLIGLSGFEESYPREISGGMKQRVGLARALVCDPEVLFMDEPFSAVDAFTAEGLRSEVLQIWSNKTRNLSSIVIVSHDIKEVVYMADRIFVIEANPGRVRSVLNNTLPRPRDYRSPDFLDLMDKLHDMYTTERPPENLPVQTKEPVEACAPILSISSDEVLGFLQYLSDRGGEQNLHKIGAGSNLPFDRIVIAAEAAEMLDFVGISHRMVTLTQAGKEYLATKDSLRRAFWGKQLLTIPLFIKIVHCLLESPNHALHKEQILQFLIKELPHQDAQTQAGLLIRWGHYGDLFSYRRKTKEIVLKG